MKKVTLNKKSWHFKIYSFVVDSNAPKSLCPYFWTMVAIFCFSPILLCIFSIGFIVTKLSKFFDRPTTAKERGRKDAKKASRVKFWNRIGDAFKWFIPRMFLLLFLAIFVLGSYLYTVEEGIGSFLLRLLIIILIALTIIGFVYSIQKLAEFAKPSAKKFFRVINPLNWKVVKLLGIMIVATYKKMCPMIEWKK